MDPAAVAPYQEAESALLDAYRTFTVGWSASPDLEYRIWIAFRAGWNARVRAERSREG